MQLLLTVYGAALSTVLAVLTIIKFLREKPKISVEVALVYQSAHEQEEAHGVVTRIRPGDDGWSEVDVEFRVQNSGSQACQIADIFVETATAIQKIRPNGLPAILDPHTHLTVRVQPEYFVPKVPNDEGG